MKYRHAAISSTYAVGQIGLGLLLHPYQTLQSVVQEKVFGWMTIFPSVVLAVLVVLWRVALLPFLEVVFECQPSYPFACEFVVFLSQWVTFFCIYWQVLLLYLYFRFSTAFKNA
jgi:hypothetical protein